MNLGQSMRYSQFIQHWTYMFVNLKGSNVARTQLTPLTKSHNPFLRKIFSPIWNSMSLTLWSAYFICLHCVARSLAWMLLTLFWASFTKSAPKVSHLWTQTNLWVVYILTHITPQMVPCRCVSDNCYCRRIYIVVKTYPNALQSQSDKLSTCVPTLE